MLNSEVMLSFYSRTFAANLNPEVPLFAYFGMKAMSELYDILDLGYVDDYLYVICSFSISIHLSMPL